MPSSVRKADKTRDPQHSYDKSERLNTRRETREVDELRMQVEVLERQLADAGGAGVGVGGAVGKSESREVKEVRKELGELGKKLARVEEERDEALSAKKSLAAQLSSLESSRASDTLTRDLKLAQQEISKLKAKLKVTEEEGKTYLTRLEQLEGGAETVAVAQVNRQKKEINEKLAKMEEKITKLEEDKVSLAAQFKAAKAKHDHLEALSAAYERDNQRLTQQLKDSQALSEKAEKALADARTMAKAHSGGCSAEEKTRLTERIAALEGICATLEQSTNGSISGAPDPALVSTVRRYHELLSNLRLSEDDVSNLLANGSDWPPVRASLTDSSLIDLLWLLNDQQDEAEEERQFLGEKVARLEAEVAKQKKRAEAAIAASYRGKKSEVVDLDGMEELRKKREELERELEAALADKEREKARAQEMIAQLEARASAFEVNASRVSRAESPSRMSSSFAYGTVASGNSQGVVDRLTKTINELNDQVAELRDENTTLLLKLVGVDE